jgi:carbamoyl-phosphate synthase large subunit
MIKPFNVLVFPGGTEIGLEIWRSLRHCKEIILYSAASNVPNHASFAYRHHTVIPDIRQPEWIGQLTTVLSRNRIDYIFPANSFIIDALLAERHQLAAEIIIPNDKVCTIVRSKSRTYEHFRNTIPTPRVHQSPAEVTQFPIFVKPDRGYGAQGAQLIRDDEQLSSAMRATPELLLMEYLPGREYTIDCFSTAEQGLLFCSGRERNRIRMGTSMNGILVDDALNARFHRYAQRIVDSLGIDGAWFFQMKEDAEGELRLLEIEPRIAGTMALNRIRGVNFPLLSIFYKAGIDVDILLNPGRPEIDRCLVNRYRHDLVYHSVYVDLDDTILVHGKINTQLVQFLYQAVNEGKRIILISKSLEENKQKLLRRLRMTHLFDEIIWLKEQESKADHIRPDSAIYIDDSFSQRKEVHLRYGIPTFDASMVELLIDERT